MPSPASRSDRRRIAAVPSRSAFENESPKRNETCSLWGTLRLRQPRSELGVRTAPGLSTQPRSEPEELTEQRRRSRN